MWYKFTFSLGTSDPDEVGETKIVPHPHHIDFAEEFKTLVTGSPANVTLSEAVRDRAMKRTFYLEVPEDRTEFDGFITRFKGEPSNQPSEETTPRYPA